jgi:hypothetical protein
MTGKDFIYAHVILGFREGAVFELIEPNHGAKLGRLDDGEKIRKE